MKWALVLLILSGCAWGEARVQNSSTAKLCIDYLSFPPANVWQGMRERELARRGEDCSAYTNQAALRQRALEQQTEMGLRLMQPQAPAPQTTCQIQTNANGTGSMVCR